MFAQKLYNCSSCGGTPAATNKEIIETKLPQEAAELLRRMSYNLEMKRYKTDINGNPKYKPLHVRKEEVMAIRSRYPTKIPVIVQKFYKETNLPPMEKSKFLVPQEISMSQFLGIMRNRMKLKPSQTLYLLVNNRSIISLQMTLAEVYTTYAGEDGYLHVTYASQEAFGR